MSKTICAFCLQQEGTKLLTGYQKVTVLIMKKLNSTHSLNKARMTNNCPLTSSLLLISGRWKLIILWQLRNGTLRFSDLQKNIQHTSKKMLTQQLKEMEHDGLLTREVFPVVPPRVEYTLTPLAESLLPILDSLYSWGANNNIIEHVQRVDATNS